MDIFDRLFLLVKGAIFTFIIPLTFAYHIPRDYFGVDLIFSDDSLYWFPGYVLVCLGLLGYLWCVWHFLFYGRGTPAPFDPPRRLVVQGLYLKSRNPMYVSILSVILGWALIHESLMLIYYGLTMLFLFDVFIVGFEEPILQKKFPVAYPRYRNNVPRWFDIREKE
tara:strand:- start:170 stop:667 length:498 start_codon:yes stop_codon:yes gene_type:complete